MLGVQVRCRPSLRLQLFILHVGYDSLHVTESRVSEPAHQGATVLPDLDKGHTSSPLQAYAQDHLTFIDQRTQSRLDMTQGFGGGGV